MVLRNEALIADCETRGITVGAARITADYAQQKALYDAYKAGHGNLAADPDAPGVQSPWAWKVHGSFHQIQADHWSHAVDYTIAGCTWDQFHDLADRHGIRFPLFDLGLGEEWHAQWWDEHGIYPDLSLPPEDDMTAQQLADALGAKLVNGIVMIPLVNDDLVTFTDYPLASAITYTHEEMKIKRIRG
jgi:hypothetical protein